MIKTLTTDILIVGAGFAGLAGALEARQHGASVILLCDRGPLANNSALSGGLFAFSGTPLQEELGVKDTPELFIQDMRKASSYKADTELLITAAYSSGDLYNWLTSLGASFNKLVPQAGHSVPRVHHEVGEKDAKFGRGGRLIKLMQEAVKARGAVVYMRTRVTGLLTDSKGRIMGARARNQRGQELGIEARHGVILAAGGFAKNKDMLNKYAPTLVDLPTISAAGSTGDGIRMGMEVGAAVANLDAAVLDYTVCTASGEFKDIGLALYTLLSEGIVVNKQGWRFMDESISTYKATSKLMRQTDRVAFVIFDTKILKKARLNKEEGLISSITIGELGSKLGIDVRALTETIVDYNKAIPQIDAHGHPIQRRPLHGKLFAIPITGRVIMTYGGLKINAHTQVIHQKGHIIPGLFAAGDTTTGLCGPSDGYNVCPGYLTGCGNLAAICFGRIAGINAAQGLSAVV